MFPKIVASFWSMDCLLKKSRVRLKGDTYIREMCVIEWFLCVTHHLWNCDKPIHWSTLSCRHVLRCSFSSDIFYYYLLDAFFVCETQYFMVITHPDTFYSLQKRKVWRTPHNVRKGITRERCWPGPKVQRSRKKSSSWWCALTF